MTQGCATERTRMKSEALAPAKAKCVTIECVCDHMGYIAE
jgi:hypothetical protein